MNNFLKYIILNLLIFCGFSLQILASQSPQKKRLATILVTDSSQVRIKFGADKLKTSLSAIGYQVAVKLVSATKEQGTVILIGTLSDEKLQKAFSLYNLDNNKELKKEGFSIAKTLNKPISIVGKDASGVLYGCLALAEEIKEKGKISEEINITEQPEMVLRGTCIGLQKPTLLSGRGTYEYPYTPESFPWFYDKSMWIQYLDMMVENRYNSLYLWNGHPFSSLVKLKEYPYAVEVDDETFKKNEDIFRFLTQEADKRGIWVIQMFYNIIIPKPFAEKHHLETQDRNRPIIPIIADYTRKSIAAFVEKYPNVGLLITLGEAMEGVGQDDVDWFTKTIIPGVQDGLKAIGQTTEPPIVLRAHDTDAPRVMKEALPLYKNLYTMAKFNGEALTTYTPRGSWAELHRSLSRIGTVHVENVHILANLEPFRYSSPDFIQKSVLAMHNTYEANGLHLYPQASYWDWPFAADKVGGKRLMQIDRDWMWYKTWARYAWDSHRKRDTEINYWGKELANKYGLPQEKAKNVLEAMEEVGEISPKLLRRYGITDGNRQTLTLGMLMTQLINPFRYGLFTMLYESEAPEGEMIIEYADKEWKNEKHIGETPVRVADEVVEHGRKAVVAINKASKFVTKDKAEFARLKNDTYCYDAMANFYAEKVRASLAVLRYKNSNDIKDLEKALPYLESSVKHFGDLVKYTQNAYFYANSMQTKQRKIPMRGVDATFIHWKEMLPVYQKELTRFKFSIDSLKSQKNVTIKQPVLFENVEVKITSNIEGFYQDEKAQQVFSDTLSAIGDLAVELKKLKGIKFNKDKQQTIGTSLTFTTTEPVKLLVGFFNDKNRKFLQAPELETDASANDYGQSEIKISNALLIAGFPAVNIHAYSFKAGSHTLNLGKGACLVLGFMKGSQEIPITDAGLAGNKKNIDWLFE
ncbi:MULTISPECIES: alpha-glucuronidase family glycosyl hydrolase [unclassified Arcicella]|uniref:alpha-d-galacturonidase n=1 Tax=unclassified Arcicella TaxID=2644986 RepID=UPI0028629555|nr:MULTISPECIES: alpha-glucuronidase family glycosyl hydrolase [unclassified Arcicella]MDR6561993.1 hypothetical protein [Arcicella sp. BE51]MDR6811864.1 hypothetical protein [Arcicella sp. BE140]MDR6822894.1 hypothetical protein [Arcicella sp. BE139]